MAAVIPWSFLADHDSPPANASAHAAISCSFARVVRGSVDNTCSIPLSQLPLPCLKGDTISVSLPEEEYLAGLADCKTCLHARLLLPKGSQPLRYTDLRQKVAPFLTPFADWRFVPLGKGYFEFSFTSVDDMHRVLAMGSWNLNPGSLRLFSWSRDFNPHTVKHTNSQCWVRMYGIPREYWRPKIFFSIARAVGTPLAMDDATRTRAFG